MKRRKFISNITLFLLGNILLSGCDSQKFLKEKINCSSCKYCLKVCPRGINIPYVFEIYNQYVENQNRDLFKESYEKIPEMNRPNQCFSCSLCAERCPKSLNIPFLLEKIVQEYSNIK
ncbi:4Fe-4S dicluster domain-containing protein [bacterium]|nr:4Fe-4S dicluster domain-containing protein [bacterium]